MTVRVWAVVTRCGTRPPCSSFLNLNLASKLSRRRSLPLPTYPQHHDRPSLAQFTSQAASQELELERFGHAPTRIEGPDGDNLLAVTRGAMRPLLPLAPRTCGFCAQPHKLPSAATFTELLDLAAVTLSPLKALPLQATGGAAGHLDAERIRGVLPADIGAHELGGGHGVGPRQRRKDDDAVLAPLGLLASGGQRRVLVARAAVQDDARGPGPARVGAHGVERGVSGLAEMERLGELPLVVGIEGCWELLGDLRCRFDRVYS